MSVTSNSRIAKNTLMLSIRMLLIMFVSLYTSRVVLSVLGVDDFGIYNVVAGVVTMFSFLNSAMAVATQRYLSFEIGKENKNQLNKVFVTSMNIHLLIGVVVLVISETIGLWFLNNKLTIPADRMQTANWIYQFSILSFVATICKVPYNASIISHEKMGFFALVSVFEVSFKLVIVLLLSVINLDKLLLYGFLMFFVSLLLLLIYRFYCKKYFEECYYVFQWDGNLFKEMLSYTGWNLFGSVAYVSYNQGINILLNMFFGPAVNAARGIAYQVQGTINGFVSNFQIALNPQITKSYAIGDGVHMNKLIFAGAKYSFFILYIVCLPLLLETDYVLNLWLKNVPEYGILFCKLVLVNTLVDSISQSVITGVQATGNLKKFQIVLGSLLLLILPVSYVLLKNGFPPQATLYTSISIAFLALFTRLFLVRNLIKLSIFNFIKSVMFPIVTVAILSCILPYIVKYNLEKGLLRVFLVSVVSFISAVGCICIIGLSKSERFFVFQKINDVKKKIKFSQ